MVVLGWQQQPGSQKRKRNWPIRPTVDPLAAVPRDQFALQLGLVALVGLVAGLCATRRLVRGGHHLGEEGTEEEGIAAMILVGFLSCSLKIKTNYPYLYLNFPVFYPFKCCHNIFLENTHYGTFFGRGILKNTWVFKVQESLEISLPTISDVPTCRQHIKKERKKKKQEN